MNFIIQIILFSSLFLEVPLQASDHAPIHGPRDKLGAKDRFLQKIGFDRQDYTHHEGAAEIFKNKYFRDETTGNITQEKTLNFLQKLFGEYERTKHKLIETQFLETLDVLKSHTGKAERRALLAYDDNEVLDPYNLYLVPKVMEMVRALENGEDNAVVEGLLDQFIRGYVPYFNPNPFNNIIKTKLNVLGTLYHIVRFPTYFKETHKIQANNLRIETKLQRKAVNKILKYHGIKKFVGDFLTHEEIATLLEHGFDISELNPGDSPLWRSQSKKERAHMYDPNDTYFPRPDMKKTYEHVMLGGANSDKIKLTYLDDYGQKQRVKLKIGDEVHLELASSALMKMIGFNTDWMRYSGDVTFFLREKTFENFEAEVRQKFGQYCNIRFNYERGITPDGEAFITWRDTLFEARMDDEKRIAPLDISSWDLQNRREYRGISLAVAWIGLNDLKSDNMKTLLVKSNGQWIPQHRIHDLGVSLGATLTFTGRSSVLSLPAPYGKANQFETKFIKKKKDGVQVVWNDFCYQYRQYNSATYYDLKWMARKIAALTSEDFKQAFAHSGMHPDMAHLYTIKIIKRRNNIVRRFELENEFGIIDTPKLKNYSPSEYPTIINGKLTVSAYEAKNSIPILVRTWGSLVSTIICGGNVPFASFANNLSVTGANVTGQVFGGGISVGYAWEQSSSSFGPFDRSGLKPGITIIPSRRVMESPQALNTALVDKSGQVVTDEENRALRVNRRYMVEDRFTFAVGVNASLTTNAQIPVNILGNISVVQKVIIHRRFVDSVRAAWLSPFSLPRIIALGKAKFAAEQLRDLENIESYYSVGPSLQAAATTGALSNGASFGVGAQKFRRKLFYRDQFGKLHYLTDRVTNKGVNLGIGVGKINLNLTNLAFFDVGLSKGNYQGSVMDYVVGVDQKQTLETHDHAPHTSEQAQRERLALEDMKQGHDNPDIALNFKREFTGGGGGRNFALAFVFARIHTNFWGQIEDTFRDGQVRKLFQGTIYTGNHIGKKDVGIMGDMEDIAVLHGKSRKTIVESELRAPEKFVVTVNHKVFARKASRKGLNEMIRKLNARYSGNPADDVDTQFFTDLVLPDKDEQDEYRKIYAEIKTMVDGEYLIKRIKEMDASLVDNLVEEFFRDDAISIKLARWRDDDDGPEENPPKLKNYVANSLSLVSKKRKIIADFNKLKRLLDASGEMAKWPDILLTARDLVHHLSSRYYGVHLLAKFLNQEVSDDDIDRGLLVYGEIRNIGDHITTLERPYGHHANLRNAGRHWGGFSFGKDKIRFVQYFLKYEDPTNQVPIYSPLLMNSAQILGRLENGQPPNFTGEGI